MNPGVLALAGIFALAAVCALWKFSHGRSIERLLAGVIDIAESRPSLEVGTHPWSASIVAAHGDAAGTLDDLVPAAVQEKLARAAAHGFFITHLGNGKAAFAALSNQRDVDLQIAYLAEWV